jgi:hypothetical protein
MIEGWRGTWLTSPRERHAPGVCAVPSVQAERPFDTLSSEHAVIRPIRSRKSASCRGAAVGNVSSDAPDGPDRLMPAGGFGRCTGRHASSSKVPLTPASPKIESRFRVGYGSSASSQLGTTGGRPYKSLVAGAGIWIRFVSCCDSTSLSESGT